MLFRENSTIESHIVQILSLEGGMTAAEISRALQEKGCHASLQGIYKVLKQLIAENVLIKNGKLYSIRLAWVLDLGSFVSRLEETYFTEKGLEELIPTQDQEKKKWHFTNSIDLIDFWINLQTTIITYCQSDIVYAQFPHAWFGLMDLEKWNGYKSFLSKHDVHQLTVYSEKNYLNQYVHALIAHPDSETVHYDTFNEILWKYTDRYMTLIQDYIVTVKFSDPLVSALREHEASAEDNLYVGDIYREFNKKRPITLTIKKDTRSANNIRKKFKMIFGPAHLYTKKKER